MNQWTIALFPQHQKLLEESHITQEVASARKYRSADTKAQLERYGYESYQRRAPGLLIPMWSVTGEIWGSQFRPDNPRKRGDKAIKYESPKSQSLRLDVHPMVVDQLANPNIELWITEGVRKADAAVSQGLCCIALCGVFAWRGSNSLGGTTALADWESVALKGRRVVLAFDSDVVDKPQVRTALRRLAGFLESRGAHPVALRLPAGPQSEKVGLDDWFAQGGTVAGLSDHIDSELLEAPDDSKRGMAMRLLELAQERYEFGLSTDGEVFACAHGSHVARLIRGGALAAELSAAWVRTEHDVPSASACRDALVAVEGLSQELDPVPLSLRFGRAEKTGAVVVDLADSADRALEISADGWRITNSPGVLFRRTKLTMPLADPVPGGGLAGLRAVLNLSDEDWPLVVAWLVMPLVRPNAPHPILALRGEQGTGKTTAAKVLCGLLDPSPSPIRRPPEDESRWRAGLAGSRFVVFDNLSGVRAWLADGLCRAVTGDAEVTRQLYTDDGLVIHELRRSMIVTTIDAAFMRGDLADRTLPVDLARIDEDARRSDDWAEAWLANNQGTVLGGLCDLAVLVHAHLGTNELAHKPRMADFAEVLAAVDMQLGTVGLATYTERLGSMSADVIDADVVGTTIVDWIGARDDDWEGTPGELLLTLYHRAGVEPGACGPAWPADATRLSSRLKRLAPALRSLGVTISFERNMKRRIIRVQKSMTLHDAEATSQRHRLGLSTQTDDADDANDAIFQMLWKSKYVAEKTPSANLLSQSVEKNDPRQNTPKSTQEMGKQRHQRHSVIDSETDDLGAENQPPNVTKPGPRIF